MVMAEMGPDGRIYTIRETDGEEIKKAEKIYDEDSVLSDSLPSNNYHNNALDAEDIPKECIRSEGSKRHKHVFICRLIAILLIFILLVGVVIGLVFYFTGEYCIFSGWGFGSLQVYISIYICIMCTHARTHTHIFYA